jgi:serine/threonine protein kinase/tetratricopeptide (TPR) repeat protein
MASPSKCSKCGAPLNLLPGGSRPPLCLSCLLGFGLKHGSEAKPPAEDLEPATLDAEMAALSPSFDRYRLLEKLGEGGCGVVYRAEQLQPVRREVAIKIIKLGMDSRNVIARFEAERQALALMDHPGIAKVFDGGATSAGRPYFVMELVSGEPVTQYCRRRHLSVEQRLGLFIELCQAVQHAHQKGIIHRDLKPSNVLVVDVNGAPQPKVIDFGVARATSRQRLADDTLYTAFDQFVGTPAYMSPEQAGLTGEDVDTRSDIYSLGVLLYELVTDTAPFEPERLRNAALDEVCRIIREEEPMRPSTRVLRELADKHVTGSGKSKSQKPKIADDLDCVVMKALEKDRARRYETASTFAADVRRFLAHEPVVARPPSTLYRFRKLVRRNKLTVGAAAIVILALVGGFGFSTWRWLKEKEARRLAAAAEKKANAQAARSDQVARLLKEMLAGAGPSAALGRDSAMLREILNATAQRLGQELTNAPEVQAELLDTIGRAFYDLKDLDKAEATHREALHLLENSRNSPANSLIAASLVELATVLNTRANPKDLVEAESLLRRALLLLGNPRAQEQTKVADALDILAWNLRVRNRAAESESLERQALTIRKRLLAPDDPATIRSLIALATILAGDRSRLDEAESLAREAHHLQERAVNPNDPSRIETLHALANILTDRDKLFEAESLYRDAIALRRKLFGKENELLSALLDGLAFVLSKEGKLDEAEKAIQEAIGIQSRIRGPEHPNIVNYMLGILCDIYQRQQKWAEAEAVSREWVPLIKKVAPEHKDVLVDALFRFGVALLAQGKLTASEPPLRESLQLCEQVYENPRPPDSTRCMGIRGMLGEVLLRLNRYWEAEPFLLAAYDGLQGHEGKWERIDCQKSIGNLAKLYDAIARPEEAAKWRQKLAESNSTTNSHQ